MVKVSDNVKLLKLGLLYGANAAGKSNILLAINTLLKMVTKGPRDKEDTINYDPFLFDNETAKQPTELNLVFYDKQIEYEYYLSFNKSYIVSEKLAFSPERRKATIYSRSYSEAEKVLIIYYGTKCTLKADEKMMLKANTIPSASVLYLSETQR